MAAYKINSKIITQWINKIAEVTLLDGQSSLRKRKVMHTYCTYLETNYGKKETGQ
jgi:hypothetical protein